jgi:hypothetical protein
VSPGDTGLRWSEGMSKEPRRGGSSISRKLAMVFFLALLVGAGKLFGGARAARVLPSTRADPSWSRDLEKDRRFERSLIWRTVAVLLFVAALTVARQLLS